jgi:hypothetical protein
MGESQGKEDILVPGGDSVRAPKPAQRIGPIAVGGVILAGPPSQPRQGFCPAHIALGRRPPEKPRPDILPVANHALSTRQTIKVLLLLFLQKKKNILFLKKKKQKHF